MAIRSLALLSFVATAFCFAPSAHADTPPPTTSVASGSSSSGSTSGAGGSTGTATSTNNPNCTISSKSIAGTTCQTCDPSGSACGNLGSDYSFVCQNTATVAVWCNGPARETPSDQNVNCAVAVPGGAWSGLAAFGALVAAAALGMRRRRQIKG